MSFGPVSFCWMSISLARLRKGQGNWHQTHSQNISVFAPREYMWMAYIYMGKFITSSLVYANVMFVSVGRMNDENEKWSAPHSRYTVILRELPSRRNNKKNRSANEWFYYYSKNKKTADWNDKVKSGVMRGSMCCRHADSDYNTVCKHTLSSVLYVIIS